MTKKNLSRGQILPACPELSEWKAIFLFQDNII
jgi:hypothetical protein